MARLAIVVVAVVLLLGSGSVDRVGAQCTSFAWGHGVTASFYQGSIYPPNDCREFVFNVNAVAGERVSLVFLTWSVADPGDVVSYGTEVADITTSRGSPSDGERFRFCDAPLESSVAVRFTTNAQFESFGPEFIPIVTSECLTGIYEYADDIAVLDEGFVVGPVSNRIVLKSQWRAYYSSNTDRTQWIVAGEHDVIKLSVTAFNLESGFDTLTFVPAVQYGGQNFENIGVHSSGPELYFTGAVGVYFQSDSSIERSGYVIEVEFMYDEDVPGGVAPNSDGDGTGTGNTAGNTDDSDTTGINGLAEDVGSTISTLVSSVGSCSVIIFIIICCTACSVAARKRRRGAQSREQSLRISQAKSAFSKISQTTTTTTVELNRKKDKPSASSSSSSDSASASTSGSSSASDSGGNHGPPLVAIAKYTYHATTDKELSFEAGAVIMLKYKVDDHRYMGFLRGESGYVPAPLLDIQESKEPTNVGARVSRFTKAAGKKSAASDATTTYQGGDFVNPGTIVL